MAHTAERMQQHSACKAFRYVAQPGHLFCISIIGVVRNRDLGQQQTRVGGLGGEGVFEYEPT